MASTFSAESAHGADVLNKRGNELRESGDYAAALASYDAALARDPNHLAALYNRSNVLLMLQRPQDALVSFDRLLASSPDDAEAHSSRGNALFDLGRLEEALASYDRALSLDRDYAAALFNRGNVLFELNRLVEALESYNGAVSVDPSFVAAHIVRGNLLLTLQRPAEALASYDAALQFEIDHAEALSKRGDALLALGRPEDALLSFDQSLHREPRSEGALNNRGNALQVLKRPQDALESYDRALAINPDFAEAASNRAGALLLLKRPDEALASADHALALHPELTEAHCHRGYALYRLGRYREAATAFERAIALEPSHVQALTGRGHALLELDSCDESVNSYDKALAVDPGCIDALLNRGAALAYRGRYEQASRDLRRVVEIDPDYFLAQGSSLHIQMRCCEWTDYEARRDAVIADVRRGKMVTAPHLMVSISDDPSDQLLCAQTYARDQHPVSARPLWTGERFRHDRIRIAYVSSDFRDHATSVLLARLFELHDRRRFEITAISLQPETSSPMGARLKDAFERFIYVGDRGDREIAQRLRELETDIVVDLNGFTINARTGVMALRPAPLQVNYLGYPGTMGAPYIDYLLADDFVVPRTARAHYSECVAYLPDCYQANDSKRDIAEQTPTRAETGLPDRAFVFCCFNNNYKITPEIFAIWMRLLHRVDGGVLWLLRGTAAVETNLRREAAQRGIDPGRLLFAPKIPLPQHLARHRVADLFLDTLPCNAHTTASDALWAGLPLVTCCGNAFAGRVAGSLLRAIGLPDLITEDLASYETLAFELATQPTRLHSLRARLAKNRDTFPLFDTERFRRHIEAAYVTMWERYQRGEPPESFDVEPLA